jgi:hypothetical protein
MHNLVLKIAFLAVFWVLFDMLFLPSAAGYDAGLGGSVL